MFRRNALEMRVIILAPVGRDAALLANTLAAIEIETAIANTANSLLDKLAAGAGAAIIADEGLTAGDIRNLTSWLASQPPWSDPPFIILTASGRPTLYSQQRPVEFSTLGHFTLIDRPSRTETI